MWSIMDRLLILAGCSILAPSVFGQSEETQITLELSTASVMDQITERIYMMVTDGSEHIIAPTPTTLSSHHTPKSHPLPIFVIPSLNTDRFIHSDMITSVAPFEGLTNSPSVTIITSETVSTVSQKSGVMISDKMAPTELKTKSTPPTTHESSSRPVTRVSVPGSSAITQPGGGGPPYGRPTRPPIASSADHTNIYISVSVIIIVLIVVSGIGIVSLTLMHKYRAAKRRVSDAMGMDLKKRRNTPWHLYYTEPVPGHND